MAETKNTGSVEFQITRLTERINYLTEHLKVHTKDKHSKYGLVKIVGKRKRLLRYLKKKNLDHYNELTSKLKIRG